MSLLKPGLTHFSGYILILENNLLFFNLKIIYGIKVLELVKMKSN